MSRSGSGPGAPRRLWPLVLSAIALLAWLVFLVVMAVGDGNESTPPF